MHVLETQLCNVYMYITRYKQACTCTYLDPRHYSMCAVSSHALLAIRPPHTRLQQHFTPDLSIISQVLHRLSIMHQRYNGRSLYSPRDRPYSAADATRPPVPWYGRPVHVSLVAICPPHTRLQPQQFTRTYNTQLQLVLGHLYT